MTYTLFYAAGHDIWGGYNYGSVFSLVRPENLEELVNMVTQEPSDDMEEKLKYK